MITLGIIGVVAAITLPTLIQNYRKQQAVTQLKATYSILSQAFEHAQADYGDMSTWGLNEIYGTTSGSNEIITKFIETYFVPYVKPIKNYGISSFKNLKYDGIYYLNGKIDGNTYGAQKYIITLSNGTIAAFSLDGHCYGETGGNAEDGTWYCTDFRNTNVYIVADINGKKLPNTIGKDIFVMSLNAQTNKFEFYNYSNTSNNRDWLLKACSKDWSSSEESRQCGRLIQLDGWKINYDW